MSERTYPVKVPKTEPELTNYMALMERDIREAVSRAMARFLENDLRLCAFEGNLKGGTTIPAKWRTV